MSGFAQGQSAGSVAAHSGLVHSIDARFACAADAIAAITSACSVTFIGYLSIKN